MKRYLFILLISFFLLNCSSQKQLKEQPEVQLVEETQNEGAGFLVLPQYKEGDEAFEQYLMSKLKDIKLKKAQKIYIYFIVEKDGSLSTISFSEGTDVKVKERLNEALQKSKKWNPGIDNGKPVRYKYKYPLSLKRRN